MATFDDLSQEDKIRVLTWEKHARSTAGNLAQILGFIQVLNDYWDSGVGDLIADLDGDIPSASGLAGIELKPSSFFMAVDAGFNGMVDNYYTAQMRQTFLELAGPENVTGRLELIE